MKTKVNCMNTKNKLQNFSWEKIKNNPGVYKCVNHEHIFIIVLKNPISERNEYKQLFVNSDNNEIGVIGDYNHWHNYKFILSTEKISLDFENES